jgi:hypothetical protein
MPLAASDLKLFGPASHPLDDTSASGGGINTAEQPEDFNQQGSGIIVLESDGTDNRTVTIRGRTADGTFTVDDLILAGTPSSAQSSVSFERVLSIEFNTASSTRTVTVRSGVGGPVIATIPPGIQRAMLNFIDSSSESSAVSRYEKVFWKNTNTTTALTSAQVTLTEDPRARIRIALATVKNDAVSVPNRRTNPGLTFSDDGVALTVPGGTLGPDEAIGVWIEQSLPANDPPHTPVGGSAAYYTLRLTGRGT